MLSVMNYCGSLRIILILLHLNRLDCGDKYVKSSHLLFLGKTQLKFFRKDISLKNYFFSISLSGKNVLLSTLKNLSY